MARHLPLPLTLDLQLRYQVLRMHSLRDDRPLYLFLRREIATRTCLLLLQLLVTRVWLKCPVWLDTFFHVLCVASDDWLYHLPDPLYLASNRSFSLFETLVYLLQFVASLFVRDL